MEEICIIGGGVVGVLSAKISLSKGLNPVLFEKSSSIGGIWAADPSRIGRWESLKLNTSHYTMTFSDHLWPEGTPTFPTGIQYLDYLNSYVSKHDLLKYMNFNTEVIRLEKEITEGYRVWYRNSEGVHEKVFRYVVVAIGKLSKTNDLIKHKERFNGTILHAGLYRNPEVFENKRVVVIGSNYSGCDIAYDASRKGLSSTLVYRRKFCINDRFAGEIPAEFKIYDFPTIEQSHPLFYSLAAHAFSIKMLLFVHGNIGDFHEDLRITDEDIETTYIPYPVSCPEFYQAIKTGDIKCLRGEAVEYCENGIVLASGEVVEADLIIDATGYHSCFDFLGEKIKEIADYDPNYPRVLLTLFRGLIHPELPGLAFAGNNESYFSGCFELGSELCIRWVTGTLGIDNEELREGVKMEKDFREESKKATWVYDLAGNMKEIMRVLKINLDYQLIKDLEYTKGVVGPVFYFSDRPGQIEIIREYVRRIKCAFPNYEFN